MGKYEKKKVKKTSKGITIALVLVFVLATLTLLVIPQFLNSRDSGSNEENPGPNAESQAAETEMQTLLSEEDGSLMSENGIIFPIVLEDSRLEVESVFQFSGINPDADKQEASDVGAVIIKNTSEAYLKTAAIRAVFQNGSEQLFMAYDLPAGTSAMVFSADNRKLSASDVCVDIDAESVFEDVKGIDGVLVSVDGITITLQNTTDEDLFGIDVYCRDIFNDKYFGGVAYKYTIEKLPAGESTTVSALDCVLGTADVVRIAINNQK